MPGCFKCCKNATDTMRKRLALVGRAYLDPTGTSPLPPPTLIGPLSAHLALLARADREDLSPRHHALLLGAVSTTERRRVEIERMLGIAREVVPREIRHWVKPEMQAALDAIDASLAAQGAHFAREFYANEPDTVTPVEDALAVLNNRSRRAASEVHHQCSRRRTQQHERLYHWDAADGSSVSSSADCDDATPRADLRSRLHRSAIRRRFAMQSSWRSRWPSRSSSR